MSLVRTIAQFLLWSALLAGNFVARSSVQAFCIKTLQEQPDQVTQLSILLRFWDSLFWFVLAVCLARLVVLFVQVLSKKVTTIVVRLVGLEVFLVTVTIGLSLSLDTNIVWILATLIALAAPFALMFRNAIDDLTAGVWLAMYHNVEEDSLFNIKPIGSARLVNLNITNAVFRLPDGNISVLRNRIFHDAISSQEVRSDPDKILVCIFELEAHASVPIEILKANVTAAALHAGWRADLKPIEIHVTELCKSGLMYQVEVPHRGDVSRSDFRTRLLTYLAREQLRSGIPHLGAPIGALDKRQSLLECALFQELNEEDLSSLLEVCEWQTLESGEYLCNQGEQSNLMWIICTGMVEIEQDSKPQSIFRGRGELIGEISLLTDTALSCSCRAASRLRFLQFERETFHALMMEHPQILHAVQALVKTRLSTKTTEDQTASPLKTWLHQFMDIKIELGG